MKEIERICVFCGSKSGDNPAFEENARLFGEILGKNNIELVYGAGGTGIMKAVAESAKKSGARVTGMTIEPLFNIERPDLFQEDMDNLQIFHRLFARKVAMTAASDAFVVLPGGLGTMDELFELMVLKQLNLLHKPIIILNIDGFFNPLRALITHLQETGFVRPEHTKVAIITNDVNQIIPLIEEEIKQIKKDHPKDENQA